MRKLDEIIGSAGAYRVYILQLYSILAIVYMDPAQVLTGPVANQSPALPAAHSCVEYPVQVYYKYFMPQKDDSHWIKQ